LDCHRFVHIPARHCLNLATAVAVILAHRRMWRHLHGKEPILPLGAMLREQRGPVGRTPTLDAMGWDGIEAHLEAIEAAGGGCLTPFSHLPDLARVQDP
jgi:predicted enzyme related to lactoylglutathione lyase